MQKTRALRALVSHASRGKFGPKLGLTVQFWGPKVVLRATFGQI